MSDDASNSSDPQARRRRRRRRRGPVRADDGPDRGERAQGSEQRAERGLDSGPGQGEQRASDGPRRRVRSARQDGRSDGRSEGRSDGRSEARGEERGRRRRRRRPRGEGGSDAGAPESRDANQDTDVGAASSMSGEPAGQGGRDGGRLRGSRGGSRGRRQRDERGLERRRESRSPEAAPRLSRGAIERAHAPGVADDVHDTDSGHDDAPHSDRSLRQRRAGATLETGLGAETHVGADEHADGGEASEKPRAGAGPESWDEPWNDPWNGPRTHGLDDEPADGAVARSADEPGAGFGDEPGDALPAEVTLHPDLPDDAPDDDPDPLTWPMTLQPQPSEDRALDTPVRNVVGVKFSPAGRIYLHDAGDQVYQRGDTVVVESDRGVRIGTVAVDTARKPRRQQDLKRVLRRPNRNDLRAEERNQERAQSALKMARDVARSADLPIKIFRVEYAHSGKKAQIYFTAEDRVDFRDLVRELSLALGCRVEMRQTGVRDEAKLVGGIGSCGQELCCTTWLPEFVPVSIKMAKDQGLVLNPTKVSGQCGRLKCCLVYEQPIYAELRKGLPKLGKRVVTEAGEGRVVEVDVLHQRVRVSLGPGEFQVFPADQVKPMFPSQQQQGPGNRK